ncbi:uncharacterized protein DSM5745_08149 [Aspergillus mulundensis]|uniref:Uncharacterized protein n=1 Tax=Aspergillus mulundensis TaxID=1810919 RepID=A0A3D8R9Q6_9EURO|nr:hypothetical protein DSM5745_08149 [Aspergillus mulundensis]RDW70638.1 hypothetical protein DSM5745_08149 [Aspergillus mulundensis]
MSFVKNIQLLSERTIKVTTNRPVRNIAESRLILAALQKFGEVVHFRNASLLRINNRHVQARLKASGELPTKVRLEQLSPGDGPGWDIDAIFDTPSAAQHAIDASPLTIDTPPRASISPDDVESDRTIRCNIDHAPSIHEEVMSRNPWYGPFKQDKNSPAYTDLAKQLEGETAGLQNLADAPRASKESGPFPNKRKFKKAVISQMRADSLMGLWQEGIAKRKEGESEESQESQARADPRVEKQIDG